ncbi:helix-turn-helix domain-containing protein [bacterium]|nr:helix-turn-helix domain-containing protein [bacterium]MBR1399107.1 helix-turn-helix domain-containing protein [Alphaproteobacteria bacterium]
MTKVSRMQGTSLLIEQGKLLFAFAYAWRYKKLYESGMPTDDIAKQEHISKRTIYKYLNLAYLSPKLVNQLLDGTMSISLQKLFEMSAKRDQL